MELVDRSGHSTGMRAGDRTPDWRLWLRARDGDAEAFGVIFDRHAGAVYNHCFRRTASWEAAEDLVSVVFLELWRRRFRLDLERESILPLLLGIANRVISTRRRSLRRHRAALARLPRPLDPPDVADQVAGRVDDERVMGRIRDALDQLPRRDREVLTLCVWAGMDYASAAEAMGVPVGTVRSRLSRARRRLAKRLAAEPQPALLTSEEAR